MAVSLDQLTSGEITGTGVFDTLMAAGKAHIQAEFTKGRITGPEYSQVYLGMFTAVLGQSIQFLLQRDITNKQVELIGSQMAEIAKNIEKTTVEIAHINKDIEKATAEIVLINTNQANAVKTGLLIDKNVIKTTSETALMDQKTKTELAQILDAIAGVPVAGYVGKQRELLGAQVEGFKRDAEQKLLKILSDVWSVQRSTDPDAIAVSGTGMENASIAQVVAKAKQGIDIP